MTHRVELTAIIPANQSGQRLDRVLATIFPNYSRSLIKKWILNQHVMINGEICNVPKEKILGKEVVNISTEIQEEIILKAQNIPLNIVYEDDDIIVINKPRGLIVHPGIGNPDGTVLNALLYYYHPISKVPRSGIVHRLDKDTTGLMVIAKTISAHTKLVQLLQMRAIIREYEAIAVGCMAMNGTVNKPICRHPTKRTHMYVHPMGKPAITHYHIIERFHIHTHLRLRIETGRTHQIRVHMAYINHPLVGDATYGRRPCIQKGASEEFINIISQFDRQALHSIMLRLYHPTTNVEIELHAPIPHDMANLIRAMRADLKEQQNNI